MRKHRASHPITDWKIHKAICGKRISNTTITIKVRANGVAPNMTSWSGPRLRTPCTTNRLIPPGGVIMAVSINSLISTPNQTGSKPSEMMTGVMMGTVATIIERVSMKKPRMT